jgi:inorganic triphosphatase YgiF
MPGAGSGRTEVELKLALDPEYLPKLKQHPMLRARRPSTTHLQSTYYDTPDLRLANRDLTLRVRRNGRQHVQTVKAGDLRQIGLFEREEAEQTVPRPGPDLAAIGDGALRRAVGGAVGAGALKPIFGTEVKRTRWQLGDGSRVAVEVDLDVGHLKAGRVRAPICELELELKKGRPRNLIRVARTLGRAVPLRLDVASKAARGLALYRGEEQTIRRAETVTYDRDASLGDAVLTILKECLAHAASNQAAVLAGTDIEGVHQMRVGLRRMRATLGLFRHQFQALTRDELASELRWLAGALAPARAWDVFLDELLPPVALALAREADLAEIESKARAMREAAYGEARSAIGSDRFLNLMLSARLWFVEPPWTEDAGVERPARDVAAEILERRHRKAKRLIKDAERLEEAELHALRLRLKKLRYAAEFFVPLFAERSVKAYVKAIAEPQQTLGHLNDTRTLKPLLEQLAACSSGEAAAKAVGAIAGFYAARSESIYKAAPSALKSFSRARRFWN